MKKTNIIFAVPSHEPESVTNLRVIDINNLNVIYIKTVCS